MTAVTTTWVWLVVAVLYVYLAVNQWRTTKRAWAKVDQATQLVEELTVAYGLLLDRAAAWETRELKARVIDQTRPEKSG